MVVIGRSLEGRNHCKTVSSQQALSLASKYGASIQYNTTYQSPFFRYTDENGQQHEVWFEDARSAQAKFDVVKIIDFGD